MRSCKVTAAQEIVNMQDHYYNWSKEARLKYDPVYHARDFYFRVISQAKMLEMIKR